MTFRWPLPILSLLLFTVPVLGDGARKPFQDFFENNCIRCHDGKTKKGNLDLTALAPDLSNRQTFNKWVQIHDRVKSGTMPPKKRIESNEKNSVVAEMAERLIKAEKARMADGRAVARRLTRAEFEYTMQDLFSLPGMPFKNDLPTDETFAGFNRSSAALDLSDFHLTCYMDAAKRVVGRSIATRPEAPRVFKKRYFMGTQGHIPDGVFCSHVAMIKDMKRDPAYTRDHIRDHNLCLLGSERAGYMKLLKDSESSAGIFRHFGSGFTVRFIRFKPVLAGRYKFRTSVWSFWWDNGEVKPARKTQIASLRNDHGAVFYMDAPSLAPKVHEFEMWLEPDETLTFNTDTMDAIDVNNVTTILLKYKGPGMAIDWLDVEGPIVEQWPPVSHTRLFADVPIRPVAKVDKKVKNDTGPLPPVRVYPRHYSQFPTAADHGFDQKTFAKDVWSVQPGEGETGNPTLPQALSAARKLLKPFLTKAFRRPATDAQVASFVAIVEKQLKNRACFEDALRAAYQAALYSPNFLFHLEPKGRLDDWALAARLSYFLWDSLPDETLNDLAAKGKLTNEETLRQQFRRMIADPRADRFIEDFLGQWLALHDIGATTPDSFLYPEFSPYVQDCMLGETHAFFRELLRDNLGIRNLIDSDFAMLNAKLGEWYGIADVQDGPEFKKIRLPAGSQRGGILTHASILRITANGTTTSPVKRGAWILDRLLGTPAEPPPPAVPGLVPDVSGAATIREQLAQHRDNATCAACHARIDPPGLALENYDVVGRWRDRYRSRGRGEPTFARRGGVSLGSAFGEGYYGVNYKLGAPVDSSGTTADGVSFNGFEDFKKVLLKDERQLARNYLQRLIIYATGEEPGFADRQAVERILDACANVGGARKNSGSYGMRTMIEELIVSDLFRVK